MPGSAIAMDWLNDLMVSDLTNARLITVTRREILCELAGLEYLLNPCSRLDTRLNLVLDTVVGCSLKYKYSVAYVATQYGLV